MKGSILLKALEVLKDGAMSQVDFFSAVMVSGYGASMNKIDYEYGKRHRAYHAKKFQKNVLEERKKRLQIFISKMKRDCLIEEIGGENKKFKISVLGNLKLAKLRSGLPSRHYRSGRQSNAIILSFDIPEKFRRKRDWLREAVKNLGFTMVHQSVWVGNVKIPRDFIEALEDLKILEYVQIFEITKTGSLERC